MEWVISLLSLLGVNSILLFFVKRYFDRRDKREQAAEKEKEALYLRIDNSLETLRLLSYHRMSQEIERLLDQAMPRRQSGGFWMRCITTTRPTAGMATWMHG